MKPQKEIVIIPPGAASGSPLRWQARGDYQASLRMRDGGKWVEVARVSVLRSSRVFVIRRAGVVVAKIKWSTLDQYGPCYEHAKRVARAIVDLECSGFRVVPR